MNKLVKGAVAGAAGIALLLGGASTFALWNASATANAGVVQSGQLKLEKGTAGATWTDLSTGTASTITDIGAYRLVPGSKIQFSQPLTVTAVGTNLTATLAPTLPGSTTALGQALTKTFTVTSPGSTATPAGFTAGPTSYTVAAGSSATTQIVAVYTLELPSSVEGTTTQNGTVDLTQLAFTLTQQSISGR